MAALEQSLDEETELYKGKLGDSVDQDVVARDGIEFLVTRGAAPPTAALEQSSDKVTELYKGKVGDSVDEDAVAKDDIDFLVTRGSVQRMDMRSMRRF